MSIKIEVDMVDKATPMFATMGGLRCALGLQIHMREFQAENLFYQLWEEYGDEVIFKWIAREGFTVTKNVTEEPQE